MGNVVAVLDLDSDIPAAFSSEDILLTEKSVNTLVRSIFDCMRFILC